MESKSPPHSSRLIIDNDAIAANFRDLARRVAPATCGAVIKADGYGLGAANVAPALLHAGCRSFFVARLSEAEQLQGRVGRDCAILILNGLDPGSEAACCDAGFVPVLNSPAQLAAWRACARSAARPLPAALQVDTGMSRLGLTPEAAVTAAPRISAFGEVARSGSRPIRSTRRGVSCAGKKQDLIDQAWKLLHREKAGI